MPQRPERNLAAALLLAALTLPAAAQAQDAAAAAPAPDGVQTAEASPQAPAAAAPAAPEHARPASQSKDLSQTREQLTRVPSAADFRPNGPITINANRAEMVQNSSAIYVGNVTLDSDTLKMDGDRLELKRAADGPYTARITGSPGHMSHAGDGPDNPPVSARAKTMIYDSRSGVIDLIGDALLTRGKDETTAEKIRYYVAERRYEASGGDTPEGRVKIVIPQINPPPDAAPPAAPVPAPAAGAPPASDGNRPPPAQSAPQGKQDGEAQ
jgi:lipopolysaccharide export system protein LptA